MSRRTFIGAESKANCKVHNFAILSCLTISICLSLLCCPGACAGNSDFDAAMKLITEKEYDKALPCLDRSVDAEPTNGSFHFWRGKCLASLRKTKEACAEYKLASVLAADARLKENCRAELARFNLAAPKGSVNEPVSGLTNEASSDEGGNASDGVPLKERMFKLSSKKLEWNLALSSTFLQQMKNRTDNLEGLAKGRQWRVPAGLSQANRFVPADIKGALLDGPAHYTTALSAGERKALSACDVVLILDHSGSMTCRDCPSTHGAAEPRISWCAEEMESFADTLESSLPHGFTFITFDAHPQVHRITSSRDLRETLQTLSAGGGTDLASALDVAFTQHKAHPQQPLLIAVITDAEIELHSCERSIVNATRIFPLPNGVFITLLQVGIEAEANTADRLTFLENLKSRAGAAYDPFFGVPFSRLRREGLGRDLLIGLRVNSPAASQTASGGTTETAGSNTRGGSSTRKGSSTASPQLKKTAKTGTRKKSQTR